jgi:uncharacterized membrane protein YbhN (UPF0104 family)
VVGVAVIAVLVQRLGMGTVVDAVAAIDPGSLALGTALAVATTVGAAWRWRLVARRLRVDLRMPTAVASCYRSQFLNSTLPGGVLGDVGRGVAHGRDVADVGRGLRTVAWERAAGQVVLAVLTAAVLVVTRPFDVPLAGAIAVFLAAAVVGAVVVGIRTRFVRGRSRLGGLARADLRALLEVRAAWGITVASVVVVAGHVATFVVAARTVGVGTPVLELVPVALVVLVASAVPLNLAGWGPREGAAAWVFGAVGTGAAQGVATAVAYGTIVLVAALPGAVLLLVRRQRTSAAAAVSGPLRSQGPESPAPGPPAEGVAGV